MVATLLHPTTSYPTKEDSEVLRKKALKAAKDKRYYNRGGKYMQMRYKLRRRIAAKQIRIKELERILYEQENAH